MEHRKKVPVFIILIFHLFMDVRAVETDTTGFRLGAKIGAGTTCLTHHHLYMLGDSRVTFTMGFTGEYWFKPWLAARLSVEYTHKGGSMLNPRLFYAKDDPMLGIPEWDKTLYAANLTIHALEIPVTACFAIPLKGSAFKPFVVIGPSFGHNFHARADNYYRWEFNGTPNDLLDETSDFVTDKIEPWNISVYTGLGMEIHTKKKPVFEVGITFRLGMTYEDRFYYTLYHKYSTVSTFACIGMKF
ncbi:MAG: PorT family protein [Bacteroidales bacterium]|nr:PorT family protein [Bacteroidales bacterium]